ncbi:MAG TPA: DUF3187 family protein [Gammaproteobacteria bacterium]|nr:DUF3187 family protein [Gammaproteobacteria bacterium]
MISIREAFGAVLATCIAGPALAQQAEPMHIRNLNPLVAIFGLPAWDTVSPGNRFGATFEIANHYRLSARGGDSVILDGETHRTTVAFAHAFDNGWSVGAEVPYYEITGGFLDDAIDAWHSAFGLPDEGRNRRPEDALLFEAGRRGNDFLVLDRARGGVGDVQLKAARTIGDDRQFVVEITAKLPTGDPAMLSGSGSADAAITLLRSQPLLARKRPAGYYWGVGAVLAGTPDGIGFDSHRWVYTGIVGGSWQPWPKFGLKAQLDVHGPFYSSPLHEFGEAASMFTFGAWRPAGRRGTLHFAIVEDVGVGTAPDVVFQVASEWRW